MVIYNCDRCGYSCTNKSYMKKHLLRKIPCAAILNNIDISVIYDKIYGDNSYNNLTTKATSVGVNCDSNNSVKYAQIRSNTLKYAQTQI